MLRNDKAQRWKACGSVKRSRQLSVGKGATLARRSGVQKDTLCMAGLLLDRRRRWLSDDPEPRPCDRSMSPSRLRRRSKCLWNSSTTRFPNSVDSHSLSLRAASSQLATRKAVCRIVVIGSNFLSIFSAQFRGGRAVACERWSEKVCTALRGRNLRMRFVQFEGVEERSLVKRVSRV